MAFYLAFKGIVMSCVVSVLYADRRFRASRITIAGSPLAFLATTWRQRILAGFTSLTEAVRRMVGVFVKVAVSVPGHKETSYCMSTLLFRMTNRIFSCIFNVVRSRLVSPGTKRNYGVWGESIGHF